jgi:ribosomal protein S1
VQRDQRQKLDKTFQIGEALRARIIKIDTNERKIGLTTRDVEPLTEEERSQHESPAAAPGDTPQPNPQQS